MPSSLPRPGQPARGSTSGQPFSVLLDLLGRRWAITVLWALHEGPRSFGQIRQRDPRIANSTLSARLKELTAVGLVEPAAAGGYALTGPGSELVALGAPLASWAQRWAAQVPGGPLDEAAGPVTSPVASPVTSQDDPTGRG